MMKNKTYKIRLYMLLVFSLASLTGYAQFQPIVVDTSDVIGTCELDGNDAEIKVHAESPTGDNIALNITLQGTYSEDCIKTVTITNPSANLIFQGSPAIPFSSIGSGIYQNDNPLEGNEAQNFNVFFKFPNYTTCDGTVGVFNVEFAVNCNGVIKTCNTSVSVRARAENYWSVSKEYVTGDLACGESLWNLVFHHSNPNASGIATYNLDGSTLELVPVISGASYIVQITPSTNTDHKYPVILRNCDTLGASITNSAKVTYSLGDNCGQPITEIITANSPPLEEPNPLINFTKSVISGTNLAPGCDGTYRITACNFGNVPWTNLEITDNLNIPWLNIIDIDLPANWTSNPIFPPVSNTNYTFTAPPVFQLNPQNCVYLEVHFTIDPGAPIGTTISNTAYLQYQAVGTGGSGSPQNSCLGITCPPIDPAIQNTEDDVDFVVEDAVAIPTLRKCIVNPPITPVPPIYSIGDVFRLSIMVGNSGSGNLTTTVLDDLYTIAGQNLQYVGGMTTAYYVDESKYVWNNCGPRFNNPRPVPPNLVNLRQNGQSLMFDITDLPGNCYLNLANYVVFEFDVKVLAQPFGNKINTAEFKDGSFIPSSAKYTIDQVGILGIHKEIDSTTYSQGQPIDFKLTVTNDGSVPLNNIEITDILPDCFELIGNPDMEDSNGNFIDFLPPTSKLVLTVHPPTEELLPGESIIAKFRVNKLGDGSCCNPSASVTAKMTTTGLELDASVGNEDDPVICVDEEPTGSDCCQISDVMVSLEPIRQTGKFNLGIDSGGSFISNVEVSMDNFQVEYDHDPCEPANSGVIGNISSSTTNFSGLTITNNNSQLVSWIQGTPAVLNGNLEISVSKPGILNLPCCNGMFRFCLKVRLTDVNGNVCEKLICGSSALKSLTQFSGDNEPKPF